MKAKIVVGLGFGDEGKGAVVSSLLHLDKNQVVVRFSGGQQAGHTVYHADTRHVFSNFGAGALQGKPSYFSEHTCFYLNTIKNEKVVLESKYANTDLTIHPLANMTTPLDVAYNRMKEKVNLHGSCGLGIAATMKRNIETPYKIYAVDLLNTEVFLAKYESLNNFYTKKVEAEGFSLAEFNKEVLVHFEEFFVNVQMWQELFKIQDYSFLDQFEEVIFEGSQGIMLDMDHGIFPNVTFANTTSKNAIEICTNHLLMPSIETYYVTRCYQTRHGNGFMSESPSISLINNEEETNVPNEWQGTMRVKELDYGLLNYAISLDSIYNPSSVKNLVITCMDQRPSFVFDEHQIKNVKNFHYKNKK